MAKNNPLGTLDFETDPFVHGRVPYPFACGIYFSDANHYALWEPDIIEQTVRRLRKLPPCTLYAHNGGKFDFHYLIEESNPGGIIIRNGRVVEMQIGDVTLKDSWPLMCFPLEQYRKTKIDYRKFEANRRGKNKAEIISYMIDDCRDLLTLLTGFKAIVGDKDTIASASFYQMRKLGIDIITTNEEHDEMFRPFYYGGHTEAFRCGVFKGNFKYVDINSAYPYAMLSEHPSGTDYRLYKRIQSVAGQDFIRCMAESQGALPLRANDGSLTFPRTKSAEFAVTGWEILAGMASKTVKIKKLIEVWRPQNTISFRPFVEKFYAMKAKAKANGDKIGELAYKYSLNAPYGKFAQNPRDFKEYILIGYGFDPNTKDNEDEWTWEGDFGGVSLWWKPSYDGHGFYDVCTSASITGYTRAHWWRGFCASKGVLYGDTDSMICESSKVPLGSRLGQWKKEACPVCGKSDRVIEARIGGKKLYGIKFACKHTIIHSKGARLSWAEMLDVCNGKTVKWSNAAPSFSLSGPHFIERNITSTGDSDND